MQSSYVRWLVELSNNVGQRAASCDYHTISASGDGSSGTNYDETTFEYDSLGRQNMVTSPGGTIAWNVFDRQDRAVCTYVGTNASGATDDDPTAGREPCSILSGGSSSSASCSDYITATNIIGDTIFEKTETDYDDAGNVIETRLRRRHHDATGTGELTTPTGS